MFLNKNWKFYSPMGELPNSPSVEDDSLSKNYTDNVDATKTFEPTTPLEKMLAKMNGDDVDIPTPANGLEYQVKRMAENPPSGGLPDWSNGEEGMILALEYAPIVLVEAQTVTIDTSYGQMTHGFDATGFVERETQARVAINGRWFDLDWNATESCFEYTAAYPHYLFYANGGMAVLRQAGQTSGQYTISDLTTTWGSTSLVPTWVNR